MRARLRELDVDSPACLTTRSRYSFDAAVVEGVDDV